MNKIIFFLLWAYLGLFCTPGMLFSQSPFWRQTSIPTDRIDAIAVDSAGCIFAGGINSGTIYRSTDNGCTWSSVELPLVFAIHDLKIGGQGKLLAGTDFGVFESSDTGASWKQIGLTTHVVTAVAIAVDGARYAGTTQGIFRASVNDNKWNLVSQTTISISDLALSANGKIFAGAMSGGVFRSIDNGNTWELAGLPNAPVAAVGIDPQGIIYAATRITISGETGVFRSTNDGNNWQQYWNNPGAFWAGEAIAINSLGHVFFGTSSGGVFRSTGSPSWTQVNSGLIDNFGNYFVQALAISPDDVLWAGMYSEGLFRSQPTSIPNQPPAIPLLLSPDNGSRQPLPLLLKWNLSNTTRSYHLQVASDSLFDNMVVDDSTLTCTALTLVSLAPAKTYFWHVRAFNLAGKSAWSQPWRFVTPMNTRVMEQDGSEISRKFMLLQNYPNPFNPSTAVQFSLPRSGYVTLKVYNTLGEEVATLVAENLAAGKHQVEWNAKDFKSTIYFYRLQMGALVETKKLLLLK